MAGAVPTGVQLEAAEAARDTLGGAIEVAGQLPGQLGPAMIDAAREAFNQGLHLAAAISAVGSIALAILVVALLRRVRTGAEPEDQPDFEPRWTEHSELERTRVIESPDVTHLRFRVVKQDA